MSDDQHKTGPSPTPNITSPILPGCPLSKHTHNSFFEAFLASLVVCAACVPAFLTIITVCVIFNRLIYQYSDLFIYAVLSLFIVIVFIFTLFFINSPHIVKFSRRQYDIIYNRYCYLYNIYGEPGKENDPPDPNLPTKRQIANQLKNLNDYLENPDSSLRWISSVGYVEAWRKIHRIEEDITMVEEEPDIIYTALRCQQKLPSTKIENKASIEQDIARALAMFAPLMADFASCQNKEVVNKKEGNSTHSAPQKANARDIIRFIRREINEARDNYWEAILQLRNLLIILLSLTIILTYLLVSFTLLCKFPLDALKAGIIFYLIGAISGVFGRFYEELQQTRLTGDYGLSMMRLVATPFIAGLAGIGGVLVTLEASTLAGGASTLPLVDLFILKPATLLIAATFGLTPNLIMQALQKKAGEYQSKG